MSTIRDYLQQKADAPAKEWLRRDPPVTHPDILALEREARAAGISYDDDRERFVEEHAGDLPEHYHHGHEKRHPLTYQLGHELYIARRIVKDEEARARLEESLAAGFVPLELDAIVDGGRYLVMFGTVYNGEVPTYSAPVEVRARRDHGLRVVFLPKKKRTHGYLATSPALVKAVA